jgi:L-phenylalanine/L-methionine N-acetyltransferase
MAEVTIRPVRAADADAIHELRIRPAVAEMITSYPSEREDHARGYVAKWGANDHVFVAECDGRVVAMAGLHVRDGKARHSAWLGIAVHDEFHGRGIGRALCDRLLEIADKWLGLVRVDLTVLPYNTRAVALYEKLGFVLEGTQRKATYFDGKYHDLHFMARIRG